MAHGYKQSGDNQHHVAANIYYIQYLTIIIPPSLHRVAVLVVLLGARRGALKGQKAGPFSRGRGGDRG